MSWIKDIVSPNERKWEEFYRNRWQYDKVVRSTHGVNCTGGCSWCIYVKNGIVTWELQALDYPAIENGLPPYEPRGCQRGISFSWYIYSPLRIKYPYIRGVLMDLWREAKTQFNDDPAAAWESIVSDENKRKKYQQVRGKGGLRRASWEEALEIISASVIYTIKKWGSDRIIGFSPIPAMSMLSYAAGARFLQLIGGVCLSFYDWYADLPNASPEIWGEQTDVPESADWYNSKFIAVMGSNPSMTRTPDAHFLAEAKHNGSKLVVFSPDFSQVSKYADWWLPINAGQDGAFWMAVNHVILKEFYENRKIPYFIDYLKSYTDTPFLVILSKKDGEKYEADKLLKASDLLKYEKEENGNWKFLIWDEKENLPKMPLGTIGFRWGKEDGKWNLQMKDGIDGGEITPALSFIDSKDVVLEVMFLDFAAGITFYKEVPVKYVDTKKGKIPVTTIFDLLMANFGISRGLKGNYPDNYNDPKPYTPAWQEKFTGIGKNTLIKFAREFAENAEKTQGKSMIIIGAGINQWYHSNLVYRAAITSLILCGCVGKNGGGLAHYVGQEKLAPIAPWSNIAFALDWIKPPRLQNTPSFHYVHTDQWRYEKEFNEYISTLERGEISKGHTIDIQAKAVRMGWLPFYPQFNKNPLELVKESRKTGAKTNPEIVDWLIKELKNGKIKFSVEDPDAPENWPRLWFIWRGNALMSSAKGHEYFLKHYLGATNTNTIAKDVAKDSVTEVKVHDKAPEGKIDLVIDINFRMDTSALYSDIVLPTATWYEKNDLNTTDLHSYIHPLSKAVAPCWESKSDWDIFKEIAKKVSELAKKHFPLPFEDIVSIPLLHDTPAELAQEKIADWKKGQCEPIPGKTMPNFIVVERDLANLYERFISFGPKSKNEGIGAHGINWDIKDLYEEILNNANVKEWNGEKYPSLENEIDTANIILKLAPETNGKSALRAFEAEEKKVGLPLKDLVKDSKDVSCNFNDLLIQPKRILTSPCWSGIVKGGRAYSPYTINVERLVPWRTLTGRQHFYLDHEFYIIFGENFPTYKPLLRHHLLRELGETKLDENNKVLNFLTPHSKWSIHSTYYDNHRMLTLSRGIAPLWINDKDAYELGIKDNDWVEVVNDNGVVVTRVVVSARVQSGAVLLYHSPERTISVPKSPLRGNKRAGGHNSLTRIRLKPNLMAGGYGHFTWAFNYWGPIGVNRDTYIYIRKLNKIEF